MTHTVTHTRKCLKRIKDHRIGNPVVFFAFFSFREIVFLSKFYTTCAITVVSRVMRKLVCSLV